MIGQSQNMGYHLNETAERKSRKEKQVWVDVSWWQGLSLGKNNVWTHS